MLVVIRELFAALFRIDDLVADDADRERIAAILNGLMAPLADVLYAVGCRALGVRACNGPENQARQGADQKQCLTKTE